MSDATTREERAERRRHRRGDDGGSNVQDALRTAASAAAVGAAVGAARAYSTRRHSGEAADDHDEPSQNIAEHDEPEANAERQQESPDPEMPRDGGDVQTAVERARAVLLELRGVEAESVSSAMPTTHGWAVGLEVVEVRRIPDSTDVMATYEIEIDGDGGVRRFERGARYHRSQAARGGSA